MHILNECKLNLRCSVTFSTSKDCSQPGYPNFLITMSRNYFFELVKNENFDYKINENCVKYLYIGNFIRFIL